MPTKRTARGKKIGNPGKFKPEITDKIIESLTGGLYIDDSCAMAGVSHTAFYNWMDKGRNERDRLAAYADATPDPDLTPYVEFVDAVERAQAHAIARNVAIIQKAAITTWQAAAWWLERTQARKYARMEKSELTGPGGGAVHVSVSTEELERKVALIMEKRDT